VINQGLLLAYVLYVTNVSLIAVIITRLVKEALGSGAPISVNRFITFIAHEVKSIRKSIVGAMHLAILGAVSLSILYTLIYPWVYRSQLAHYVMFGVASPLIVGLIGAFAWRVQVLARSLKVHGKLNVSGEFRGRSIRLQGVLMGVIALTATTLATSILPGLLYLNVKLTVAAVDYMLVAIFYVRPEVNLYADFDRALHDIRMPFNIKDVIEGRVDASQVSMGVSRLSELDRYETLSLDACVEIGACEESCPATAAGRPLSPRVLVRKLAMLKGTTGPGSNPLDVVGDDELWACTTCGACTYNCPVGVRHVDIIIDLRRRLIELGKLDQKKSNLLLNLSQYGNTMGTPNYGRHEWLRELGVKTVEENPGFQYLLWVGCMGSFDSRAREIVKALIEVLREAGLLDKVAVLGDEETCCGDPARRLGEEGRFQEIALRNIELFRKYGVRRIITICPHGYNTFKNDYAKVDPWMRGVEVYHHVEFLRGLVEKGVVKVSMGNIVFTIHDPCYLARYNGVVEPQRVLINRIGKLREARYHGAQTFCCGAGGANYWYDVPEERRISHIRLGQLMETGAQAIVTLCPFCNAMLNDAARVKGVEGKVKVIDIAEVIRAHLRS